MNKEIFDNLTNIGLGKNEAEVYLALLELGESKTGILSQHSKVPTSHIYPILERLNNQGLIAYKLANNVKIYYCNPPETLKTLYIEKQKQLDKEKILLIKSIESINLLPKIKNTFSDYKYFEGVSGIISMWQEIIRDLEPKTEIDVLAGVEESIEQFNHIFMEFQKVRVKKKIKQRLLFPSKMPKKYAIEREKLGLIDIKYFEFEAKTEICVFKNFIVIEYLGTSEDKPRAFLIRDKLFADYFRIIFNIIWKISKK